MRIRESIVLCLVFCAWASLAQAHAVLGERVAQDSAVTVHFLYSGGDSVAYAAVEVYSPADATVEYQNGRTDKNGNFSFAPTVSGEWRVVMTDGMGHKISYPVQVQLEAQGDQPQPEADVSIVAGALPLRVLLGISLFATLFCAVGWCRAVRKHKTA
jgi:nickel transport protein